MWDVDKHRRFQSRTPLLWSGKFLDFGRILDDTSNDDDDDDDERQRRDEQKIKISVARIAPKKTGFPKNCQKSEEFLGEAEKNSLFSFRSGPEE